MKNIGILGCGWLGLPLAGHFCNRGFKVNGSTTNDDKFESIITIGATPYLINLPEKPNQAFFDDLDFLVINIPPQTRKKGKDFHTACLAQIADLINDYTQILYVSATSVYPKLNAPIDELVPVDKDADRAVALWQAEQLLTTQFQDRLTILRLGGLMGYDRIPGKYTAGKTIETGDEKVNYIHRDDAIKLIATIVEKTCCGEIFNGVAPEHPTKKEVYLKNAVDYGFEETNFVDAKNQ